MKPSHWSIACFTMEGFWGSFEVTLMQTNAIRNVCTVLIVILATPCTMHIHKVKYFPINKYARLDFKVITYLVGAFLVLLHKCSFYLLLLFNLYSVQGRVKHNQQWSICFSSII